MKTVFILRHAKSDWSEPGISDDQRPLNARGESEAPVIGKYLYRIDAAVQTILCSPAVRAQQTAELVTDTIRVPIRTVNLFYPGDVESFLNQIEQLDDSLESAMIIAHNPALEELVSELSANGQLRLRLPTCGLVCLKSDEDRWSSIRDSGLTLEWAVSPKLILPMMKK